MVLGTLLGGSEPVRRPIFLAGTGRGPTALLTLGDRLSHGPPTPGQIIAWIGSIAHEVLSMVVLGAVLQNSSARAYWLWILLIVGVHFLPMAFAFGPLIAVLGVLCIVKALVGLEVRNVSFLVFGCVDGLLKIRLGIAMLGAGPHTLTQRSDHNA
jgi:hypothetical protein